MGSENVSMAFEKEAKPCTFNNYRNSVLLNSVQFSTHCLMVHCKLPTILGVGNSGMNRLWPQITRSCFKGNSFLNQV